MNRIFKTAALVATTTLLAVGSASAHMVSGRVFCDANQDRQIDANDLPLSGVGVINTSPGLSANSAFTDATGFYSTPLESVFVTWTQQIIAGTVPPGSTIVGPSSQSFDITADNLDEVVNWLIDAPICQLAPACGDGVVDEGEQCDDGNNDDGDGCSAECTIESFCGDGVLDEGEQCDDGNNDDGDGCSATCENEGGGEGCTPGYWKQPHHFDSWTAPLTPETPFDAVFEDAFPGKTLLDVLSQGGGGLKALGRHIVAALLNAASPGVSYDASVVGVVGAFDDVYPGEKSEYTGVKNGFEAFNEDTPCPLN